MVRLDEADALTRTIQVDTAFRPSAPVNRQDLFSGRGPQRWSVMEAIRSPGQHGVIFGERGVGKTSLAAICCALAEGEGHVGLRINCDGGDDFHSLWQKFIDECEIFLASQPENWDEMGEAMEKAAEVLNIDEVRPAQVRIALRRIVRLRPLVVYFDEFDQIADPDALSLFSNTIKMLSDQIEPVTLIPVGVADNVDRLIMGHQSISRALCPSTHAPDEPK